MKFGMLDFSLGRDFWNYRVGQLISLLGDSCSGIALAWWILSKTGSASAMSTVLAPAMVVRIFLLPLMGPLGDNFSRKKLIVIADLWRFFFTGVLAVMVLFDHFNLPLLVTVFIFISIGSALFNAASGGIVPQLVPRESLQLASQQTQAINSFAGIIGGIIGGVAVSTIGVLGAFLIDAFSYLAAATLASMI
ncbi:MAG: MFS transporter, partial [Pseudobdellovibrionaceae bacterium]